MAIPHDKDSLQDTVRSSYLKLRAELQPDLLAVSDLRELDGHVKGTKMSLNNLLAYLHGWGQLVLKWVSKRDQGETLNLPETGYKWNQLGLLAQKFYADYEADDYLSLCKKLDTTVEDLLLLIESKTNEQLYGESWYNQWPLGRMIQFNSSSPYANATTRIRKWKKVRTQQEQLS
ncbi:ClbS/DfsB family four-helix bundle protein [Arcticibacter sp.]|uniref:ClbS/DfsB family four-helix bundle protein n=1 Tax=Arcticibacter sp. TaxID=1872630 RepID=UPI00388D4760